MRNVVNIYICLTKVGVDPHNVAWELCVNAEISMIVYSISTNTQQCLAIIKKQSLYLRPHYIRVKMTPFHIDFLKWFRYLISTNATYLPIFFVQYNSSWSIVCPSVYLYLSWGAFIMFLLSRLSCFFFTVGVCYYAMLS